GDGIRDFHVTGVQTCALPISLSRFRDNYGRLLALIFIDDLDYQEHLISLGYSPYFPKYGNVRTEALHRRYLAAERKAQAQGLGEIGRAACRERVESSEVGLKS